MIAALSCSRPQPGAPGRPDVLEILELLLAFKADPNQRGINDYTPLQMAVCEGNLLAAQTRGFVRVLMIAKPRAPWRNTPAFTTSPDCWPHMKAGPPSKRRSRRSSPVLFPLLQELGRGSSTRRRPFQLLKLGTACWMSPRGPSTSSLRPDHLRWVRTARRTVQDVMEGRTGATRWPVVLAPARSCGGSGAREEPHPLFAAGYPSSVLFP